MVQAKQTGGLQGIYEEMLSVLKQLTDVEYIPGYLHT